ncbi:MAG: oligoendopeptidase F [Clostridiales bacterium]|nr:oligoendopeptidase F [Clostridiales bacterium]
MILRKNVNLKDTWDTSVLFEADSLWEEEYVNCEKRLAEASGYKGKLNTAENILSCFELRDRLSHIVHKLYVYANLRLHEDNTDTKYQALSDRAAMISVKLGSAFSYVQSEILRLDFETVKGFMALNPGLAEYKHYFDDLFREKEHILSEEMEDLLAKAHEIGEAPDEIFSMLNEADLTFGLVKDDEGNEFELTHGKYISLMESQNIETRKHAFKTMYKSYMAHKNTLAASFSANVKKDLFFAKARKYNSSLESALSSDNIPVSVYKNLIAAVHTALPSMHDYVALRKKRLKLDDIHMYDLYVPIVQEADNKVDFEKAKAEVLESLKPLGEEYISILGSAFKGRWIDVYENKGKRSGAYSWGVHGAHPFVLLNYDNKVNDMFTLAHEMGHAMHSYYSWSAQKYFFSSYTIFVAEVASTVNEALLMEYLLDKEPAGNFKNYLLNYYIEQFRGTLFRQAMFAEFEMETHQMVQNGIPLTSASLNEAYRALNRKYYGDGIILDEEIDYEWSRIPHFYSSFYVYKYATGYSAATALAKKIKGESSAAGKYIEFLKSGSSDYPLNLLKKAGVDMLGKGPVLESLEVFKSLVEKMKNI